jgi:enoyl-CoA hydratase/carnithine racemase
MPVEQEPQPTERRLVRVEHEGALARLTLDRPEALNALSEALRDQLLDSIAVLGADPSVRAVVLTGAGRAFCSGGDLKAMQARLSTPGGEVAYAGWQRMQEVARAVTKLHTLNKVTVAAVNGPAAGLGCDLALCCDFVVAASDATFAMSYVRRGLVPDGGGLYFLPRRVGLAKAKELIYSGRSVGAEEAVAIGLADRLVAAEDLLAEASHLAEEMSEAPLHAIALSKSILDRSFELSLEEVFALGTSAQAICYTTDAHREAVDAFLASRRHD